MLVTVLVEFSEAHQTWGKAKHGVITLGCQDKAKERELVVIKCPTGNKVDFGSDSCPKNDPLDKSIFSPFVSGLLQA